MRWIYKLGYRPQEHKKSLYFDGHKRVNVVKARTEYLKTYSMYCNWLQMYDLETFQHSALVNPKKLNNMKETVFI